MAAVARFDIRSSDPDDIAPDVQGMNIPIKNKGEVLLPRLAGAMVKSRILLT